MNPAAVFPDRNLKEVYLVAVFPGTLPGKNPVVNPVVLNLDTAQERGQDPARVPGRDLDKMNPQVYLHRNPPAHPPVHRHVNLHIPHLREPQYHLLADHPP